MKRKIDLNINEYKIGDWVKIKNKVEVGYFDDISLREAKIFSLKKSIIGQIVGIKKFLIGKRKFYECEPAYLYDTKNVYLWEIKQGLLNKSIYAYPSDIETTEPLNKLPLFYTRARVWTSKDREFLREDMKGVPRDKKGRWKSI